MICFVYSQFLTSSTHANKKITDPTYVLSIIPHYNLTFICILSIDRKNIIVT